MSISAEQVRELREKTGVGIMRMQERARGNQRRLEAAITISAEKRSIGTVQERRAERPRKDCIGSLRAHRQNRRDGRGQLRD